MGFFETFWHWLDAMLGNYLQNTLADVANAVEPALVTFATLYVMIWGFLHMTGRIEEPFTHGLRRIVIVGVVLAVGSRLWLYNAVIVDTFYVAPTALAAAVVHAPDPVKLIDTIWDKAGSVAGLLWTQSGFFHQSLGYTIAALAVYLAIGFLCVYGMFLIALSHVALAVLLAIGPLFIGLAMFQPTRRLFDAWLMQLANYALISILMVLVAALFLQLVSTYAQKTADLGTGVTTLDTLNLILVSTLVFMFLRQILPIASGLAGGVALSEFDAVNRTFGLGQQAASKLLEFKAIAKVIAAIVALGAV